MIWLVAFIALLASALTWAAGRWAVSSARRSAIEAEARAAAAEQQLAELIEQLRPQDVPSWRLQDLAGWGNRGLVYGGPGGAGAILGALVGIAAAQQARAITRGRS